MSPNSTPNLTTINLSLVLDQTDPNNLRPVQLWYFPTVLYGWNNSQDTQKLVPVQDVEGTPETFEYWWVAYHHYNEKTGRAVTVEVRFHSFSEEPATPTPTP